VRGLVRVAREEGMSQKNIIFNTPEIRPGRMIRGNRISKLRKVERQIVPNSAPKAC
jgi:hypothetical protein